MRTWSLSLALGLVAGIACSDEAPPAADAGQSGETDAAGEDGWIELVAGDWSLPPGTEGYVCARVTLEEDVLLTAFEAIAPPGTHHTVLTVGDPSGPDGVGPCQAFTNHDTMVFGSGVGTDPFTLPEGVAVPVAAGQQLLLNLHLFNTTDAELTGTSGTRALRASPDAIAHRAESVLMGPVQLEIPPGEHEEIGRCTFQDQATIFAVGPHMHQLGRHMTVHARRAAGDVLIHDAAYSFDDQQIVGFEPIEMAPGDHVEVRCVYDNDTGRTVGFGDSSLEEMCFAGISRYPIRDDGLFVCAF